MSDTDSAHGLHATRLIALNRFFLSAQSSDRGAGEEAARLFTALQAANQADIQSILTSLAPDREPGSVKESR